MFKNKAVMDNNIEGTLLSYKEDYQSSFKYEYPKTFFNEIETKRHVIYKTSLRVLVEDIFNEETLDLENEREERGN